MGQANRSERACEKIAEAAGQGAELVVFLEAWVAGYPYSREGWESSLEHWIPVRIRSYDNALLIASEDTDRLCQAVARANFHVVLGCNEMDPRRGVHTIYNTLLFIEGSGKILGRHRKTMPTFVERAVWGWGHGSNLVSYETDIGRIGAGRQRPSDDAHPRPYDRAGRRFPRGGLPGGLCAAHRPQSWRSPIGKNNSSGTTA